MRVILTFVELDAPKHVDSATRHLNSKSRASIHVEFVVVFLRGCVVFDWVDCPASNEKSDASLGSKDPLCAVCRGLTDSYTAPLLDSLLKDDHLRQAYRNDTVACSQRKDTT